MRENLTLVDMGYYLSAVVASIATYFGLAVLANKNYSDRPYLAAVILALLLSDWTHTVINAIVLELLCFAFGWASVAFCMGAGFTGAISLVIQIVVYVLWFFGSFFF